MRPLSGAAAEGDATAAPLPPLPPLPANTLSHDIIRSRQDDTPFTKPWLVATLHHARLSWLKLHSPQSAMLIIEQRGFRPLTTDSTRIH